MLRIMGTVASRFLRPWRLVFPYTRLSITSRTADRLYACAWFISSIHPSNTRCAVIGHRSGDTRSYFHTVGNEYDGQTTERLMLNAKWAIITTKQHTLKEITAT